MCVHVDRGVGRRSKRGRQTGPHRLLLALPYLAFPPTHPPVNVSTIGPALLLHVGHGFQLQELLDAPLRIEPSPTRLLDTAMRQHRLVTAPWSVACNRLAIDGSHLLHAHAIDMHRSAVNLLGDSQASAQVLREDGTAETIFGVVRDVDRLFVTVDGDQTD